jgi:peptide-methionine (S)-S-oxide reductase
MDNFSEKYEIATFGNGCFWCTDAIFRQLTGVIKVSCGYCGGTKENPTYKEVCSGSTGHAECLQIIFDPEIISYEELLEVFWKTHDPTTLNRQGDDIGTQYRSVIFYHNKEQKIKAEISRDLLKQSHFFEDSIVTSIDPYSTFYAAENYHQDYFNQNGEAPYCRLVVKPKVDKFQKKFKDKLNH